MWLLVIGVAFFVKEILQKQEEINYNSFDIILIVE